MINEYDVTLEGKEGDYGYFITFKAFSRNEGRAAKLSMQKAKEIGLQIVAIEEVEKLHYGFSNEEKAEQATGKSYFKLEK